MYIYDVFLKSKNKHSNKPALICDNELYSYDDLNQLAIELGNQMISKNISIGSKVGIIIDDPMKFIVTLLAVNYINAVAIPIYSKTGHGKIMQLVNIFQINYIISDVSITIMEKEIGNKKVISTLNVYEFPFATDNDALIDVELILFSSGTTNMPKAIMLTQMNIQINLEGISAYLNLIEQDKILLIKSLVHASSLIGELLVSFFNGCTGYLTRKIPTSAVIIDLIKRNEITIFFVVPTILHGLINYFSRKPFKFSSLRAINFYGEKMSKDSIITLTEIFDGVNIIYSYGLTEASPRVTYIEGKDLLLKSPSSGKPINNVSVMISTPTAKYEVGTIGEILVKGPNIMKGYYNNAELTRQVLKEDMLFTGDLGYLDEDGYLYVTGRKDNMIIISGKNIFPEEIEEVLLNYKNICEALVKGEYNVSATSLEINAYIVLNNTENIDKIALYQYLKSNLENYKVPKNVLVVDKLEKTVTGKIIRQ